MEQVASTGYKAGDTVSGEFVTFAGERYYVIRNVDQMAPFFISVISSADHWLFVSSTGGLTAGRVRLVARKGNLESRIVEVTAIEGRTARVRPVN